MSLLLLGIVLIRNQFAAEITKRFARSLITASSLIVMIQADFQAFETLEISATSVEALPLGHDAEKLVLIFSEASPLCTVACSRVFVVVYQFLPYILCFLVSGVEKGPQ